MLHPYPKYQIRVHPMPPASDIAPDRKVLYDLSATEDSPMKYLYERMGFIREGK